MNQHNARRLIPVVAISIALCMSMQAFAADKHAKAAAKGDAPDPVVPRKK